MLFKPEHVEMIKNGTKTQTRRNWKRRMVKVYDPEHPERGGIYKVKTQMLSKDHHCKIRVTDVRREMLYGLTLEDAKKEGYNSIEEYEKVWEEINGSFDNIWVYVVDFELVKGDSV